MNDTHRWLLSGELDPIGTNVAFLDRPLDEVVAALVEWRTRLEQRLEISPSGAFPQCLASLDPVQSPWSVELLVEHGNWTAYLNNSRQGSDLTNDHLSRILGCNWVSGRHSPRSAAGHAITEFRMSGPEGVPPLMTIRTVYSYAADGRWDFQTYGEVQPFEQTHAYTARLKRDRMTRAMLIDYLGNFGIRPDDTTQFGRSVTVRQIVDWRGHTSSLADEREYLGLPPLGDRAVELLATPVDTREPRTRRRLRWPKWFA